MLKFLFRIKREHFHRRNINTSFRFYSYPTYLYENCSVIGGIIGSKVRNVRALQLTLRRVSIVPIGFTRTIAIVFSPRCPRSMIRCFPTILCDPAYRLAMRIFQGHNLNVYQASSTVTMSRQLYSSCLIMLQSIITTLL